MTSVYHARIEKDDAFSRRTAKAYDAEKAAAAERARHNDILAKQPRIGTLVRKGRPVYYVTIDGQMIESADPAILAEKLRYADRVAELEGEGLDTSDAQSVADAEFGL